MNEADVSGYHFNIRLKNRRQGGGVYGRVYCYYNNGSYDLNNHKRNLIEYNIHIVYK